MIFCDTSRFVFNFILISVILISSDKKQNKTKQNKKHQFVFFSMTINHKKHKQNKTHSKKNLLLDQTQLAIYCLATCAQKNNPSIIIDSILFSADFLTINFLQCFKKTEVQK